MPSVTISTYALVSVEELNDFIGKGAHDDADKRKIRIVSQLSVEIETFLDRQIVTRGSLTEYHSPRGGETEILLGEWPVSAVTSVHEDSSWESVALASRYPATTLLTSDTDYIVIKPTREPSPFGKLLRLLGNWATGRRVVKVVYTAGYATTALVPGPIKTVALELGALMWRDQSQEGFGISSHSNEMGTVTRHLPAVLTHEMQRRLTPYKRLDFAPTWERDAA